MDVIKDITYCYGHCDKQCERNLKLHDFSGQGAYSVSCYKFVAKTHRLAYGSSQDDIRKGEDCEYFIEKGK
jgi:hypothetical protein